LANFSPGFERSENPGIRNKEHNETLEESVALIVIADGLLADRK
jgi:hypothetical protein